jgi:hypothetical protein
MQVQQTHFLAARAPLDAAAWHTGRHGLALGRLLALGAELNARTDEHTEAILQR